MIDSALLLTIGTQLFEKWIIPNLTNILNDTKNNISDKVALEYKVKFKNNFKEYIKNRIEKFSVVDTIVFPNNQVMLEKIYVPLMLHTYTVGSKLQAVKIDSFPNPLFKNNNKVIIVDQAGMGKSTVLKKIFISCANEGVKIPILIELSRINKENSLLNEIRNQLEPINEEIDNKVITELIYRGNFLIILDGFDEVKSSELEYVSGQVSYLVEKANKNQFLIASRPEADTIASLGEFLRYTIAPLKREESYELLKKYDEYNFKKIYTELVVSIEKESNASIHDFLKNPMLTSLLYKSFDYRKDIPLRKSEFYRQVYESLFMAHDYTKEGYLNRGKKSNLRIDDFDRILRFIAFYSAKESEIEYSKSKLLLLIDKSQKYFGVNRFQPSDFFHDILVNVPLFKKEGLSFKWIHKSLQDYFAARFIWLDIGEKRNDFLERLYNGKFLDKMYNLLDILYDLDSKLFNKVLSVKLAKEYISFYNDRIEKGVDKDLIPLEFNNRSFISKSIQGEKIEHFDLYIDSFVNRTNNLVCGYSFNVPTDKGNFNFEYKSYFKDSNLGALQQLLCNRYSTLVESNMKSINPIKMSENDYFMDVMENNTIMCLSNEVQSLSKNVGISFLRDIMFGVLFMKRKECVDMIDANSDTMGDDLLDW